MKIVNKINTYLNEEKRKDIIIQAIIDKSKELGYSLTKNTIDMLFGKSISYLEDLSDQFHSDKGKELVKKFVTGSSTNIDVDKLNQWIRGR